MRTNRSAPKSAPVYTHEGARARRTDALSQLRRCVMANMLFEDSYYEDGVSIAERIEELVGKCSPEDVRILALEARTEMKLRHVPLLLAVAMCRLQSHRSQVSATLQAIIQRPDELGEFLALYWKPKKCPIAAQVKKGLAAAFQKFDEYSLQKFNRDAEIRLRDVLFLCHAKPKDKEQDRLWKRLIKDDLKTPDTWEVQLSAGKDKKKTWERLLKEEKLGALALLRNLRNMQTAGVDDELVRDALRTIKSERVLPFRFVAAARFAPKFEAELEEGMFKCLEGMDKLPGKTALLVDNSGSMADRISGKSDMSRVDAAAALAMFVREICQTSLIIGFGSDAAIIPNRRGFALAEAILKGPGGGTNTETAKQLADREGYDRIIIITDEQSHQTISAPKRGASGYLINVAAYEHGIGYGPWVSISGWSEAVVDFIAQYEREELR